MSNIDTIVAAAHPAIAANRLFRPFVTQILQTIQYLDDAGHRYEFMASHSGFGNPSNSVMLMPELGGFVIAWNGQSLQVMDCGMAVANANTPESVLAYVKAQLDTKR